MVSLQGIVVLFLCAVAQAIPRRDERDTMGEGPRELAMEPQYFDPISDNIGVLSISSTDYRTMPPGTYTESISTGLVRITVVNDPTPTTTNGNCPAECDCSGIEDKESPE
ncbi:hypothetical protein FLAG1_05761 [Fusarium langsethiae]|uniref:Uncharacterized protein n=1 Tax=Fusarium langsethiae TaxID=179993 RepID=A0A0M9EX20_FUSLA|nr:hypothetical protein FLAG1_05761 [Fusarium langsethiae]GKU03325.1 unnamed protein product [Fusarium langsethiae]GKU21113.1 unnamed protein product [Fusarium langsethiae]